MPRSTASSSSLPVLRPSHQWSCASGSRRSRDRIRYIKQYSRNGTHLSTGLGRGWNFAKSFKMGMGEGYPIPNPPRYHPYLDDLIIIQCEVPRAKLKEGLSRIQINI